MIEKSTTYKQSKFNNNNISDIISKFEIKTNDDDVIVKDKNTKMVLNNGKNETNELDEKFYDPKVISSSMEKPQRNRLLSILSLLRLFPLMPLLSTTGTGILVLFGTFILPRSIGENIMYPGFRLLFGTLYPGYASYKAIRTKNVKEYVSKT